MLIQKKIEWPVRVRPLVEKAASVPGALTAHSGPDLGDGVRRLSIPQPKPPPGLATSPRTDRSHSVVLRGHRDGTTVA